MLNWLIFGVPWQIQVGFLAIVALVALYLVGRVFGWGVVRQIAMPVLAILGAIGLISRAQQQGYKARQVEEKKVEEWAENVAVEKRDEVRKMPDDKLDKEVDRWSKP